MHWKCQQTHWYSCTHYIIEQIGKEWSVNMGVPKVLNTYLYHDTKCDNCYFAIVLSFLGYGRLFLINCGLLVPTNMPGL